MTNRILRSMLAPVALLFSAACAELDVTNPNQPDVKRALATPADVAAIATSSVNSWWLATTHYEPSMMLQVTADAATANFGNFGMRFNNEQPRIAYNNNSASGDAQVAARPWGGNYSAIGAANDALRAMDDGVVSSDAIENERVRSAALFTQAGTLSNLAMLFDQAFVVDETTDPLNPPSLVGYADVRAAALAKWDALIALTQGKTWAWDQTWLPLVGGAGTMGAASAGQINRIANTMAARLLVYSARTLAETQGSVPWAQVLTYADRGITGTGLTDMDFAIVDDGGTLWYDYIKLYGNLHSWTRVDQRVINRMAPNIPVMFNGLPNQPQPTPTDNRLGIANLPCGSNPVSCTSGNTQDFVYTGTVIGDPGRGIWMQSPFWHRRWQNVSFTVAGSVRTGNPDMHILAAENDLIIAEALVRTGGDLTRAAALVNKTRVTRGGLTAVAANATDILAAIEYERDVELLNTGGISLFDRRRIDGLQAGTARHLPIPASELEVLALPIYTFGGIGLPDM